MIELDESNIPDGEQAKLENLRGEVLRIAALATEALIRSNDDVNALIREIPAGTTMQAWLEGLILAANILQRQIDKRALITRAAEIIARGETGFEAHNKNPQSKPQPSAAEPTATDEPAELPTTGTVPKKFVRKLEAIGQTLSATFQSVAAILDLSGKNRSDTDKLMSLQEGISTMTGKLGKIEGELLGIEGKCPEAHDQISKFRDAIFGTIMPQLEEADERINRALAMQTATPTKGPDLKNTATRGKRNIEPRKRGLPTPPKTKGKRPKTTRTNGKNGK